MNVKEDYPFAKERDDFLFIKEFRGTMGKVALAGGVISIVVFFGIFLAVSFWGDREVRSFGLIFFSLLTLIGVLYTKKITLKQYR